MDMPFPLHIMAKPNTQSQIPKSTRRYKQNKDSKEHSLKIQTKTKKYKKKQVLRRIAATKPLHIMAKPNTEP